MTIINYSNFSIDNLAKLSKNDTAAHPELFRKLSLSDHNYGRLSSFSQNNVLKILRDMGAELAPLAARSIGTNYWKSKKAAIFAGLKILIQKDLAGTITRVAQIASEKLTKNDNFTVLTRVISSDPEIGLDNLNGFKITKKHMQAATKDLVLLSAMANKTNLVARLVILANDHLTKPENAEQANRIVDISPRFTLAFIDKLKLDTDDKAALTVKLAEKIPEAFQTVINGQFYEKIKASKASKRRIDIDPPLFASVKDDEIGLKDLVISHAQKRTHLFFNLLTAYYNTGFSLSLNKTFFRYGKGLRSATGNFDGAHSSIITSIKIKKTAGQAFWDEASFFDLYLAHSCNGTFYLPTEVNKVDCKIEGKNTNGEKMLRQRSIRILQSVASGDIDPEVGMQRYLEEFTKVAHLLKRDENLSREHRKYLDYQIKGTNQITDSSGKILGNFFRFNLALSLPEDVEIHSTLSQYEWKDLSAEFKQALFSRAQEQTQSQRVLVINGKAIP